MSSLTLKAIYKEYPNGVKAVSDFNLHIEDKEFVVLVGPSGCGKSTTLRMIAGLEEITSGELYIESELVNDIPPKNRDIAMVFQNYALFPHMTVFENISFGLRIRKLPKNIIRQRVDEAAEILEISHLLDRKPAALSGGQRQRVALGRAIVRNPKVFLLDEPLSNLDAKLRTAMRAELSKLHARLGTTFIYVTHDQIEAMTMGTRIVAMKDGYIQQVAPPQELYEKPQNLFVATFIGTPQMNTARARLADDGMVSWLELCSADERENLLAKIALPDDIGRAPDTLRYMGKEIIFGIRPNDIRCDREMTQKFPERSVDCHVELTERLGAEMNLYLRLGELEFYAVTSSKCAAQAGDTLRVCFDTQAIHLFDIETEKAICRNERA